ncbi:MAG TPA: alpha-L-rhamnosidase C-terminal domain-containing protein, partial [Clostridia bacterium]|nr:alpha-L-rhamnosidase C-terminal domain-containing protein [Clostridia bacterium]
VKLVLEYLFITICNKEILQDQFDSMAGWVRYVRNASNEKHLYIRGAHFGDWLNLDAPEDIGDEEDYKTLIATAFYAYSVSLLIKAGMALGKDMAEYEELLDNIKESFNREFIPGGKLTHNTQTAHALALCFDLAQNRDEIAENLVSLIEKNGNKLSTGFLGTPYLLHALSDNGYAETAYTLLLQKEFPSWLYPVAMGATTVWEHWDGVLPDGTINEREYNSYNHYAYGAVADWMYGVMAGIKTDESAPGFRHTIFEPITDKRIDYVRASIDTRNGTVASEWRREGDRIKYSFQVPAQCTATVILGGIRQEVGEGIHQFESKVQV